MALARALDVLIADLFWGNRYCRALKIIGQLLVIATGSDALRTKKEPFCMKTSPIHLDSLSRLKLACRSRPR